MIAVDSATCGIAAVVALLGAPPPANDGWVTDLAGMVGPEAEARLEERMESYRAGSGHEVAVLTVPSLDGDAIEPFALRVAREWGLGQADEHNGALLVVARDEGAIRVEVGRGLEGTLTDSVAGRIVRDVIAPEFRRGDFERGIERGVVAMHAAIGGDYGPIDGAARPAPVPVGGLMPLLVLAALSFAMTRSRRRHVHRSGGQPRREDPWILIPPLSGTGRGGGTGGFGGFGGFGGGGGFSGGGASGSW